MNELVSLRIKDPSSLSYAETSVDVERGVLTVRADARVQGTASRRDYVRFWADRAGAGVMGGGPRSTHMRQRSGGWESGLKS